MEDWYCSHCFEERTNNGEHPQERGCPQGNGYHYWQKLKNPQSWYCTHCGKQITNNGEHPQERGCSQGNGYHYWQKIR